VRHEDGSVQFFEQHIDPRLYGRVVVVTKDGMIPVEPQDSVAKIRERRRKAKEKVFVQNALRALKIVAPAENIRLLGFVVLVGGSALDFEIPQMISDALVEFGVVVGRANVRGCEGPRNAVATGLLLGNLERWKNDYE
jgi:diol dehydratase reactivase alpha subunit